MDSSNNNNNGQQQQQQQQQADQNGIVPVDVEAMQSERRKRIKDIMADPNMTQQEKSRAVQSLMDGRRRSSCGGSSTASSVYSHTSHTGSNQGGGGASGGVQISGNNAPTNYVMAMANVAAYAADHYSSDEEGVGPPFRRQGDRDGDVMMTDVGGTSGSYRSYYDSDDDTDTTSDVDADNHSVDYGYGAASSSSGHGDNKTNPANAPAAGAPPNNSAAADATSSNYRQVHGRSYSLQDWSDNDRVHAAAHTSIFLDNPAKISRLMEQSRPLCEHYERMCTIVSPCCGLAFGCRICHDDCPVLPKPLHLRLSYEQQFGNAAAVHQMAQKDTIVLAERLEELKKQKNVERRRSMPLDFSTNNDDEENHHPIDRFAIREVICRSCYTRQSSKTNNCISCGVKFGDYHCNICNLWMSDTESPYHCEACGFCRVGGRENFRHCDDCGMCIDAKLFDDHNCKAGKYMSNCPVCQEDLFSSRFATHELPCQHALHWHCYKELCSYSTQCPVCKKTAETPEYMASTWNAIATGIELQPVPPDMARCVNIFCNDCEKSDVNRRWHFLGVRCLFCLSFNTNCERIVLQGRDAAEFLDALEASTAAAGGAAAGVGNGDTMQM